MSKVFQNSLDCTCLYCNVCGAVVGVVVCCVCSGGRGDACSSRVITRCNQSATALKLFDIETRVSIKLRSKIHISCTRVCDTRRWRVFTFLLSTISHIYWLLTSNQPTNLTLTNVYDVVLQTTAGYLEHSSV